MNSTVELLKECDSGAKMGVSSIKEVMDNVEGRELMEILSQSLMDHERIGDEIHSKLSSLNEEGKEPAPVAKMMTWMKINFKMATDPDDTAIASIILDGCNMGVKQLNEYLNCYKDADEGARDMARKLIRLEEQLGDKMKPHL